MVKDKDSVFLNSELDKEISFSMKESQALMLLHAFAMATGQLMAEQINSKETDKKLDAQINRFYNLAQKYYTPVTFSCLIVEVSQILVKPMSQPVKFIFNIDKESTNAHLPN